MKVTLPFVETMITQVCNLSCLGCTNYSDLKHSGYVPWNHGKQQIQQWLTRLDIPDFGIIGGEPLVNPEWREWIRGIRELMPSSQIRFTTNGLLLDRADDLLDVCREVGNIVLKITVHVQNSMLEQNIQKIFQAVDWQPVKEFGLERYSSHNRVRLQINRPSKFVKSYQGAYSNMRPWHSDPASAFEICVQKNCPLLYQGRLFKCSTVALLPQVLDTMGNPNFDEWQPFLVSGLSVTDSDEILKEFVTNFAKPNRICAQCPSSVDAMIDHRSTVFFK